MATKTETRTDRTGFVPGVVHLALDVADRGQSTAIAVLQEARAELRASSSGIEMVGRSRRRIRFARRREDRRRFERDAREFGGARRRCQERAGRPAPRKARDDRDCRRAGPERAA